jgi:transcriptional regulator with XRE-family HTH domain
MAHSRDANVQTTELSRAIWSIRKHNKMGTQTLGEALGVSHSAISRYESGSINPGIKVLLGLLPLAEAPWERRAVLHELKNRGFADILLSIRKAGLLSEPGSTSPVCEPMPANTISESPVSSDTLAEAAS